MKSIDDSIDYVHQVHNSSMSPIDLDNQYNICLKDVRDLRNTVGSPKNTTIIQVVVMTNGISYGYVGINPKTLPKINPATLSQGWLAKPDRHNNYTIFKLGVTAWDGYEGKEAMSAVIDMLPKGTRGLTGGYVAEDLIRIRSNPETLREAYWTVMELLKPN